MDNDRKYFECICASLEHTVVVDTFEDEDQSVSFYFNLAPVRFWRRLKFAVKYLFGYQCKYGHFEDMMLDRQKARELRDTLNEFLLRPIKADIEKEIGSLPGVVSVDVRLPDVIRAETEISRGLWEESDDLSAIYDAEGRIYDKYPGQLFDFTVAPLVIERRPKEEN
jgi:hypothetical protein